MGLNLAELTQRYNSKFVLTPTEFIFNLTIKNMLKIMYANSKRQFVHIQYALWLIANRRFAQSHNASGLEEIAGFFYF